eukprot:scaffold73684_cov74-Phaeocystis_antarctica.AAC.2
MRLHPDGGQSGYTHVTGDRTANAVAHTRHRHTAHTHSYTLHWARDAIHQVIATFLQFDAATVRELQAARQRKGAAQRGLIGRASLLFSQR